MCSPVHHQPQSAARRLSPAGAAGRAVRLLPSRISTTNGDTWRYLDSYSMILVAAERVAATLAAMMEERMFTVREVADHFRVTATTVRRWLESGDLRGVKLGDRAGWRVRESELERFLKERES